MSVYQNIHFGSHHFWLPTVPEKQIILIKKTFHQYHNPIYYYASFDTFEAKIGQ